MTFYGSVAFEPETSIGYQVKRVSQAMTAALEPVFAAEGISHAQWSALVSIYFERGRTCAQLARDLAYDKGAMTRLIDAMEARGWVTRIRAEGDRRLVILDLTEGGRVVAERCRDHVASCWDVWLKEWPDADVHRLLGDLKRVREVIERSGPCT